MNSHSTNPNIFPNNTTESIPALPNAVNNTQQFQDKTHSTSFLVSTLTAGRGEQHDDDDSDDRRKRIRVGVSNSNTSSTTSSMPPHAKDTDEVMIEKYPSPGIIVPLLAVKSSGEGEPLEKPRVRFAPLSQEVEIHTNDPVDDLSKTFKTLDLQPESERAVLTFANCPKNFPQERFVWIRRVSKRLSKLNAQIKTLKKDAAAQAKEAQEKADRIRSVRENHRLHAVEYRNKRDELQRKLDAALVERDEYKRQLGDALVERDEFKRQLDDALDERDEFKRQLDDAFVDNEMRRRP
jgi:hypothetical protein